MAKKVLTDKWLRSLKPAAPGKRDMHWDAALPSFGVRVTDRGSASFLVMRRIGKTGAPARRAIGAAWTVPLPAGAEPTMSLAAARDQARQAILDMQAGVDPQAKQEAEAKESQRRSASAFGVVAERFIGEYLLKTERRGDKDAPKIKSGREAAAIISRELKTLWEKPLAEIEQDDVAKILKAIAKDHPYAAHQALAYTRRLFNWAIADPAYKLKTSPCDRLSAKDLIGKKHARQRVLADAELKALWKATALDGPLGPPLAHFARMLILTGQRLREAGEAKWPEFDLDNALWTIPAERMKGDAAHEVPLSPAVVDLLKALPRGSGPFVFSTTDGRRPISGFSKLKARLDKACGVEAWRFHDIRRTLRTGLGGLPVPTNVAELVIAHAQPGLHKVYDQHRYRDEKRQALTLWANKLLGVVEPPGGNVLHFTARA